MKTFKSDLSNLDFPITEKVNVEFIRPTVLKFIKDSNPIIQSLNVIYLSENNKKMTNTEKQIILYLACKKNSVSIRYVF